MKLADERLEAVLVCDLEEAVLDIDCRASGRRATLVDRRLARVAPCQLAGLAVERCREEQRLARRRAERDDPVDRWPKAHVEHPVSLVEHEHADVLEREGAARQKILEASRGRNQHVRSGGVACLVDEADTSVHRRHPERAGMRDRTDVVHYLGGEFTRRCENQGGRSWGISLDPLDERDSEGERLARAGGGFREHVASIEDVADHVALDRERLSDALFRERTERRRSKRRDRQRTA